MHFLRSRFSAALLFKSLANLPPWTLRPLEEWISTASGPCCWVFYHSQFNASIETGQCDSLAHNLCCTYCNSSFLLRDIQHGAAGFAGVHSAARLPHHIFLFLFSVDLISALYHIFKTNIAACKKKYHCPSKTQVHCIIQHIRQSQTAESKKPAFCIALPFLLTPTLSSARNIYSRHGPGAQRQEDAGLWLVISPFPVGSELD